VPGGRGAPAARGGDYAALPGLTPLPGKFHRVHIKGMHERASSDATQGKGILHD
jgi:hypothetical protein